MKSILFSIAICLTGQIAFSQINAVTSSGEEVVLYENGTWKYANEKAVKESLGDIKTNSTDFKKNKEATFLLKSNVISAGVYLNPKKWSFKKASVNDAAEYQFQLKEKDAYAMLITERIQIPLESLKGIALTNAREVAPDIAVVKEEYRNVNGLKIYFMQMNGTTQGIKFSYVSYYYSNENGTIQLVTYTSQNLLEEYRSELEEFLNGLVILKD